jgi:predicted nucleic acid-binding protein
MTWPNSLVADSGTLIALARLGLLALPARYFESVCVTATVWDEVTRCSATAERVLFESAVSTGMIKVVDDVDHSIAIPLGAGIDIGERTAIALAQAKVAALLVDDRRARRVARELGLTVLGTVGLLIRARNDGVVPALSKLLNALSESGYYLAPELIAKSLQEVGE